MNDYTQTPNYSLYKPTPNADDDVWGDHLNANADTLDALLKRLDQRGSGGAGGAGVLLVTDYLPPGQPDGITDVAPYLQDAIDAAAGVTDTNHREQAPGAFTLVFPAAAAPYIVGTSLYIPSSSHIIIEPGASLQLMANAPAIAPLFQVFIMDLSGASNVIIELYGTFDGNRLNQMGTLSTSDTSGSNNANGGIGARGCSDIFVVGNNQGTIKNFKNWPMSFTGPCINCEVRGIRMTDTGNSASFTGQNAKPDGTKSPLATTGTLSSYTSPNITFVTQVAHGVNVGDYFYYTHAPAGSNQANFLQGEYIATAVPNATTVQGVTPPGTLMPPGTFTGGVISYCWRNVNVGFVDCYVARCPDLGLVLEGGNTNGYIRGCEFTQCNGAFGVFSDPPEPAPNRDCQISGCYVHDTYGGGILVSSNQPSIFHKNIQIFDNIICNSISGGIIIDNADGVDVFGNLMHGSAYITVLDYQSQLAVKQGASNVNVYGNTIRDAIRSAYTTSGAICTLTSYTPGTGVAVLTTYASLYPPASPPLVTHGINAGDTFFLSNAAGTGACMQLEGWHTATAVTTNTVTFVAAPSLTLTLNRVNLSHFSYSVPLSHIAAGNYTSDSSGNMILTTDIPHGYPVGAPFVIASAIGSPPGTGGPPTATDSPGNLLNGMWVAQAVTTNTITISTKPNATVIVTIGTVLPGNFGIALQSPGHCHVHGNRIEDEQATPFMTSCIGGFWRNGGACHSNYFGARVAIDPDVSDYSLGGSCGINYDRVYNNAVANTSIAGFVNFSGSAQNAVQPHQYFPPQGLTLQWNYSAGRGEVDLLCGTGLGSTGGFDFLQIATIRIAATGSTYDAVTGNVSVTTSIPHTVLPGNKFTLQLLTGTDAATPAGSDVRKLIGGQTANSDTTGTVLTFTDSANLTILATNGITGGLVVPSLTSSGSGLLNTAVGINGSLLANDGYGNTRLGGALVHGAMQLAPLASGGSVSVNPNTSFVLVQNSSSIATGSLVLPAPQGGSFTGNGNQLEIRFQNAVGALAVTAAAGAGVSGPPTAVLSAGSTFRFIQTQPGNVWLPNLPDISGTPPVGGPYLPLSGGTVIGASVFSGGLNSTPIGATTPNTGAFTNLSATGTVTLPSTTTGPFLPLTGGTVAGATTFSGTGTGLTVTNNATFGSINSTPIGATTPNTGAFTNLSATGTVTLPSTTTGPFLPLTGGTVAGALSVTGASTHSAGGSLAGTFTGAPTWSGAHTFSAGLTSAAVCASNNTNFGRGFTYALSGSTLDVTKFGLYVNNNISGTSTFGEVPGAAYVVLGSANIAAPSSLIDAMSVSMVTGGAAAACGGWQALSVSSNDGALPTNDQAGGGAGAFLALQIARRAARNQGGTGLTPQTAFGANWGIDIVNVAQSGATNLALMNGIEVNQGIQAGASVMRRAGLQISSPPSHVTRAAMWDNCLFVASGGGAPFRHALAIGTVLSTNSPLGTDSKLLTYELAADRTATADTGIEFNDVTFTTAAIRTPGFMVDPAGVTRIGSGYFTPSVSGLAVDMKGSLGTGAPTVNAGGSGYSASNTSIADDAYGGVYTITANSSGVIVSAAVIRQPIYNGLTPPATTAVVGRAPSLGTGCVLNMTWNTTATALALQPSGGATTFGGALSVAGATTLSGGGTFTGTFTGAHTYSGALTLSASGTGLLVSNNATIAGITTFGTTGTNNVLTVTPGPVSANGISFTQSGTGGFNIAGNIVATGGSIQAQTTLSSGTAAGTSSGLTLQAAAGNPRGIIWNSGSSARWQMRVNQTGEGGSNAGSDFDLINYSDTAVAIFNPLLRITRSTGNAAFAASIGVNGAAPPAKPTVSGAKGSNAALASLLAALVSYGFITDSTAA